MSATYYTTRSEAIEREIIAPLTASTEVTNPAVEFDLDQIADEVLCYDDSRGFHCHCSSEDFWLAVERWSR